MHNMSADDGTLIDKVLRDFSVILSSFELPDTMKRSLREDSSKSALSGLHERQRLQAFLLILMPEFQWVDCTVEMAYELVPWLPSGSINKNKEYTLEHFKWISLGDGDEEAEGENRLIGVAANITDVITPPPTEAIHLNSLEELRLRTLYNSVTIGMNHFEGILLHLNIRTLRLYRLNWLGTTTQRMRWRSLRCTLESIELSDSMIDAVL